MFAALIVVCDLASCVIVAPAVLTLAACEAHTAAVRLYLEAPPRPIPSQSIVTVCVPVDVGVEA